MFGKDKRTVILKKGEALDKKTQILGKGGAPTPGQPAGEQTATQILGQGGQTPATPPAPGEPQMPMTQQLGIPGQPAPPVETVMPGALPTVQAGATPPDPGATHHLSATGENSQGRPPVPGDSNSGPGYAAGHTQLLTPGAEAAAMVKAASGQSPEAGAENMADQGAPESAGQQTEMVVGWLVIIEGHGRGKYRPIYYGNNPIGRDPSQRISLDFGDTAISATEQAFIRYDIDSRSFMFVPNLSKTNIVTHNNDKPMTPVRLEPSDIIGIGNTKLQFIPFCGPDFDWYQENTA